MFYLTGDIHGNTIRIERFCQRMNLIKNDVVVILGDAGINYWLNRMDEIKKKDLSRLLPTIFCIHGNHEARPETISTYKEKLWRSGTVFYEEEYPNILFAKDGEIFDFDGIKCIAIGGAYSVDKFYRLARRLGWWADEQPSDEIKLRVEEQLQDNRVDVILSHTCPFKYEPREMFLSCIDQSTVDTSTEEWLDKIEELTDYKAWYCGHWHTNKRIDKMHFLFDGFEELGGS